MTAGTRTFPVPRTYQTWLRDLAPAHPRRLWFSHLLVHRVEALVTVVHSAHLESLPLALLRRLFPSTAALADPSALDRLCFDRQWAIPLLRDCTTAGLLRAAGAGWELTDAGRLALRTGGYTRYAEERQTLYFADNGAAAPSYLPLTQTAGPVADAGESWTFNPAIIDECVRRPLEWKQRVGFPADVEARVVEPRDGWRQVVLDRAEYAPLVFVEIGAAGGSALLGLLVRTDNWALQREPPALVLGEGWPDVLPDFAEGLSAEAWREAWLTWCQSRQQLPAEALACQVEVADCQAHVRAPKALVERLRAARSEVLRGETWLTLGTGRTRAAACVEVREQE